jgi:hypothetical protein
MVVALEQVASSGARYAITRQIYQLDHKTLRPYDPPRGAVRARYELLLAEEMVATYQEETELRAQAGDDAFWATVIATKTPDGEIETRAAWTDGVVEGHLPPVQTVCFVVPAEPAPRIWSVPWSVVETEPGMLTPTGSPLPRWKIGPFPPTEWLVRNGKQIA